jgi:ubiquitin C-terminal hydrolase
MQEALASLSERIDRQGLEIRLLHSIRKPIDHEGLLDRQRMDGDRANDRISDLLAQLKAAHHEISDIRAEVSRKLQEIGRKLQEVSDSHGADHHSFERAIANLSNGLQTCQSDLSRLETETTQSASNLVSGLAASVRSQSGTDRHIAEIKLIVTTLEGKVQSVAEDMKGKLDASRLHSALNDLRALRPDRMQEMCQPDNLTAIISRSEGLTAEVLSLEKRIAETLSETNEAKTETLRCLVEMRGIETRLKASVPPIEAAKTRDQAHEPKRGRTARQDKPKKNPNSNSAALNDGSKSVDQRAQGLSRWFGPPEGKENEQKDQIKVQKCSEPTTAVVGNAPIKDTSSCDCVRLGCGTCVDHEKRIGRLESDLSALRSQLFIPNEREFAQGIENQQFALGNVRASQGHGALPPQLRDEASEPRIPGQNMVLARGREGTVNGQRNGKPALRASSKEFIVKEPDGGTEAKDTIVRGIQRPKYSSTCYINAAIQALFHVRGFSSFLEDNSFNRDLHPLLLQLQKLHRHCRSTQGRSSLSGPFSNREVIECLNSKGFSINPKRQEDSTEFFERLVEGVADETRAGTGWRSRADVKELLTAEMVCTVACKECRQGRVVDHTHTTVHLEHTQAGQASTTISKKLHDLLRRKETKTMCTACRRETPSENSFSYQMPESLFLKVVRSTWDSKKNRMERMEQRIYPEKSFDLEPEHQGRRARYILTGGIVHKGGANSGHYLNVLFVSRRWYEIDDERVRTIPEKEAIQQLGGHGVLVMYQKERELGGEGTKSNRAVDNKKGSKRKHTKTETQAGQPTKGGRRHRFRPYRTRGSNKSKREQWGKTHITEHKGYYDPDKKCFYIPKQ